MLHFKFASIFFLFVLPTRTPGSLKIVFPLENKFFLKNGLLKLTPILGRFWRPTCLQNRPIIRRNLKISTLKTHLNFDHFLLRFFNDFGSVLGAKFEPCWPPRRPPRRPKIVLGSQNLPRPSNWFQNDAPDPPE